MNELLCIFWQMHWSGGTVVIVIVFWKLLDGEVNECDVEDALHLLAVGGMWSILSIDLWEACIQRLWIRSFLITATGPV